jgi:hypothetical protein
VAGACGISATQLIERHSQPDYSSRCSASRRASRRTIRQEKRRLEGGAFVNRVRCENGACPSLCYLGQRWLKGIGLARALAKQG